MASPSLAASMPQCKALQRFEKANDLFYDENPRPWPYTSYQSGDPEIRYDYEQLFEEGVRVYSDRYYAFPSFADMAYKRVGAQSMKFELRSSLRKSCQLTIRNNRDKKVAKFLKKKRLEGLGMDVFIRVKEVSGMPVYQFGVRPLNFDFSEYPELSFVHLNREILKGFKYIPATSERLYFSFALPNTAGQQRGELRFSDWQFCEPCMLRFITSGNSPDAMMPTNPRDREYGRSDNWHAPLAWPRNRYIGVAAAFPTYIPAESGIAPLRYELSEQPFSWVDIRFGQNAMEQAVSFGWRYSQAKSRNIEYRDFIRDVYAPLTVEAHMKKASCPSVDHPSWGEGPNEQVRAGNESLRRADCLSEHLAEYDALPLSVIYEDLVREEEMLFAETLGRKRTELRTAEDQFKRELSNIDQLVNQARRYFDKADYVARHREKARKARERKRAALRSVMGALQQHSNTMQRQVEQIERDNAAFIALELQKQRRKQWEQEKAIAMRAREQSRSANSTPVTTNTNPTPATGSEKPAYEGFDRVAQTSTVALPCADIPTAEEMRKLENADAVPGFDAGWEHCTGSQERSRSGAQQYGEPESGATTADDAVAGGSSATVASSSQSAQNISSGTSESSGVGSPAFVSGTEFSSPGSSGQSDSSQSDEGVKLRPRYIFVGDLAFEHRGFAFSSEEQARDGLKGTWASQALSKYCGEAWDGGDGFGGVVEVDGIEIEKIVNTRWVGSARLDGYCRLNVTDRDYDRVTACPTESRGQPNCYVDERY